MTGAVTGMGTEGSAKSDGMQGVHGLPGVIGRSGFCGADHLYSFRVHGASRFHDAGCVLPRWWGGNANVNGGEVLGAPTTEGRVGLDCDCGVGCWGGAWFWVGT